MLTERDFKRIVEILNDSNQIENLLDFLDPETDGDVIEAFLDDYDKLLDKYRGTSQIDMLTVFLLLQGDVRFRAYDILAGLYESLKQDPKALLEFDEMLRAEYPDDDFEDFEDDAPESNVVQFPGKKK